MSDYLPTIGLEIHIELATQTKMFCSSRNDSDEKRPNVNICPICLGYPGTLPVINQEAVRSVLRVGLAVGGKVADYTEFDRKNYFYPDIPKGYQISQYKNPLVSGGELMGVKLTRIHLEEDTAKSIHNDKGESLLDFNRAGVPLMELVTEPVIKTATEASNFARELQLLLKYLDVSGANMEKGEMRVEANISLAPRSLGGVGVGKLGTKVEVKNINSFKVVEKVLIASLPELPWQKRERYKRDFGLKDGDIEIYVRQPEWGRLLEEVTEILGNRDLVQLTSNYITSDLKTLVPARSLAEVVEMISAGEISSRGAKDILKIIQEKGGEPRVIANDKNLIQESDGEVLKQFVEEVLKENTNAPIQFLVGQAMKKSGGRANPQVLKEIFTKIL